MPVARSGSAAVCWLPFAAAFVVVVVMVLFSCSFARQGGKPAGLRVLRPETTRWSRQARGGSGGSLAGGGVRRSDLLGAEGPHDLAVAVDPRRVDQAVHLHEVIYGQPGLVSGHFDPDGLRGTPPVIDRGQPYHPDRAAIRRHSVLALPLLVLRRAASAEPDIARFDLQTHGVLPLSVWPMEGNCSCWPVLSSTCSFGAGRVSSVRRLASPSPHLASACLIDVSPVVRSMRNKIGRRCSGEFLARPSEGLTSAASLAITRDVLR